MKSRSSSAIFQKKIFLTSHALRRHFRHQGRSKSGQGHQRSSAVFQKVYFWPPIIHLQHHAGKPIRWSLRSERLSKLVGEWVSECFIRAWRFDCPQTWRDHIASVCHSHPSIASIQSSIIVIHHSVHLFWVFKVIVTAIEPSGFFSTLDGILQALTAPIRVGFSRLLHP